MKYLVLFTILYASAAHACLAFLQSEYTDGMSKVCIYDHLGSDYVITLQSHQICPVNVTAPH